MQQQRNGSSENTDGVDFAKQQHGALLDLGMSSREAYDLVGAYSPAGINHALAWMGQVWSVLCSRAGENFPKSVTESYFRSMFGVHYPIIPEEAVGTHSGTYKLEHAVGVIQLYGLPLPSGTVARGDKVLGNILSAAREICEHMQEPNF